MNRVVICEVPVEEVRRNGSYRHGRGFDEVLLVHTPSGLKAYSGVCPHLGGPLLDGAIAGGSLRCPWHHFRFDVETGGCSASRTLRLKGLDFSIADGVVRVYRP